MAGRKTHRLSAETEFPFSLIALSSSESLHRLVWTINQQLGLRLHEAAGVPMSNDQGAGTFPVFKDHSSAPLMSITLISNRFDGSILLKSMANIDFLIEIKGDYTKDDLQAFLKALKKVPGVQAVMEIAPTIHKRKTPFCFD